MIEIDLKPYPGEDEFSYMKRKVYFKKYIQSRLEYGNNAVERKLVSATPLTNNDIEEINAFWAQFMSPSMIEKFIDYRYFSVFKSCLAEGEKLSHYIPDTFYYAFIDDYYTNPQYSSPFDDKNLYDVYFYDINRPKIIFRKINDMFLDEKYRIISLDEAINKVKGFEEVVLKVGKFSGGGKDVVFWKSSIDSDETFIDYVQNKKSVVCQELIKQHPLLNELNPTSINTIRIMTLVFNNDVHVMSSAIRFGAKGNRTDNIMSGGLACGLHPDGRLRSIAYDYDGRKHACHPKGKPYKDIVIPNYEKCVDIVTALATRFSSMSRLISWDLAIDENANPLLVEFNISFGGINFHQFCNGPILGDLTVDVLKDVFSNSYTLKSIIKSMQ